MFSTGPLMWPTSNMSCIDWRIHVSMSLHFNTLPSFKAHVCTFLSHYAEWFLSTAPMPSLSSNLPGSMSTGCEWISRNRITFLVKLCYPEPAVGTLPLAGHKCFNFCDVTYDTALPLIVSFHHIWSAGRCIRKRLYDWMVWDLTKCHECKH